MRVRHVIRERWVDVLAIVIAAIVFVVPFVFMLLTAGKDRSEASDLQFACRPSGICWRTSRRSWRPATTCSSRRSRTASS